MTEKLKKIYRNYSGIILLGLSGIPIGICVGIIDTIFGKVLLEITDIRNTNPMIFLPFLSLAGVLIVYSYSKYGKTSSKGMGLVFEVGHGDENVIPKRLIPFVVMGTWITHLFGGSAGREGVAVQIGAAFSHYVGKKLPFENASKIFLITGMAAGFAGLFQTPIAAILFAMEVLVAGELKYLALFPAFTAAFTASSVSGFLGLEKFTFELTESVSLNPEIFIKLALLGLIFGIVGGMFAWSLKYMKGYMSAKFGNPIMRIAIMGAVLSVFLMLLHMGRYSGLGTNLISSSFGGEDIYVYDWILKFIFTVWTLSIGFQGGEVTPLFSIGASLGVVVAGVMGMPVELVAALGYAAVFGSATNTLFAPIFIGAEVFGFAYVPYFFVVCVVGYVFNMNKSIYTLQKVKEI